MNKSQTHRRIDVARAVEIIADAMPEYPAKRVSLIDANGAILRQDIFSERDQPPFDRVTMDGIAIRASAHDQPIRQFTIKGIQGAGSAALQLENEKDCIEIMTGAMLPRGADTIIPVERIERAGETITLEKGYEPKPGQFIHRRGSDYLSGQRLLAPGVTIGPPEAAVLTIAGSAEVEVATWPSIAVISTGNELVDVGSPLAEFQIRSSNDRAIAAALQQRGCTAINRVRLADDRDSLRREIAQLHQQNDVLILSGGVSMGKYDYVPEILEELGVELRFHKILQRPGLPMWFGVSADNKPVFALPGNPVSTLVCTIRYVIPAIRRAIGAAQAESHLVRLAESVRFEPDLTWFLPVKLETGNDGRLVASPRPTNTSGDFVSLAGTDGFVELARGQDHFEAGFAAPFFNW